jgi:hypothetical protein
MIYEDKMVTPLLKERSAEELRELIIAIEKYKMDPCPLPVRKAIQSHWDVEDPISALRRAAPWRDAGTIAIIIASGAAWDQTVRRQMAPWCLPKDIVQDMGVTLYRNYVRAYCLSANVPAIIFGEALWDGEDDFALEPYGIESGLDHPACAGELICQAGFVIPITRKYPYNDWL